MKIIFQKPLVPNFVKTDKGLFDLKNLSPRELNEFINLFRLALIENWHKRKKNSQMEGNAK